MTDTPGAKREAEILCRYLSGKAPSMVIADRYLMALSTKGIKPLHDISVTALQFSRRYHERLIIMAAILETDPARNSLFTNPPTPLSSWLSAAFHSIIGIMKAVIGKLLFLR